MNRNEYMRLWRYKNKEKLKAINRKWYEENKEFMKLKRQILKQG